MKYELYNRTTSNRPATLRNLLIILFKRKFLFGTIFFSTVAAVAIISFLMAPVYQASSKIMIEKEVDPEKALLFKMNLSFPHDRYEFINSEIEIIHSYPIAAQVIKKRNLNENSVFIGAKVDSGNALPFERAVQILLRNLSVENPKKTNVVNISYRSRSPELSSLIANDILTAYIKYRSELSTESGKLNFFKHQIEVTDNKLKKLEESQADFKQKNQVLSPEAQKQILIGKLSDYEKNLTQISTDRIGKEAKLEEIKKLLQKNQIISIPTADAKDSRNRFDFINNLKSNLADMEIRRAGLLQKFTPEYEEVVNLDKQIEATQNKLKTEIKRIIDMEEASVSALKAEESSLNRAIAKIKKEIEQFAGKEYEFNQLSRGIKDNQEIYSMLLLQREETRISQAKSEKDIKVKVINKAIPPIDPILPKKKLNILLAIFLGFFAGLTFAFLVEYFDHKIATIEEMEKYTKLKALGFVRDIKIQWPETTNRKM